VWPCFAGVNNKLSSLEVIEPGVLQSPIRHTKKYWLHVYPEWADDPNARQLDIWRCNVNGGSANTSLLKALNARWKRCIFTISTTKLREGNLIVGVFTWYETKNVCDLGAPLGNLSL
jgi:hypothetical protein